MGMRIEEAITRYKNNAEYERTHGNLEGCLEFRQLAEWLEKLQKIQEIVNDWQNQNDPRIKFAMCCDNMKKITKVIKDGDND